MAQAAKSDTTEDEKAGQFWNGEIKRATKTFKNYQDRVDKIVALYRDERNRTRQNVAKFNILWSNISTLKPALFARVPRPVIERRFLEDNDVERIAGQTLERAVSVEIELSQFKSSVDRAVLDYLLGARGVTWIRYEAQFENEKDLSATEAGHADEADDLDQDEPDEGDKGEPSDENSESGDVDATNTSLPSVTGEHISIDYVDRKDFLHDPARTWDEVRWLARRFWLTRAEATDKFGEEIAGDVQYASMKDKDQTVNDNDSETRPTMKRAEFWQIWDKPRRRVWVISPSYDGICDQYDDPLKLREFWPCPKPLYGTITNDSLIPVPDFSEYQDQAEELNDLTRRIGKLTQAIKAVGVYDASQPDLKRLLNEGTDNMLIPCETWAVLKDRGGLSGSVELFPLETLIKTLQVLYEAREKSKQALYEITGISDIMRGQGMATETATAQRIKGQFGTLRLQERQRDVQDFCRSIVRIMAELIADHYSPVTLAAMTGMAEKGRIEQISTQLLTGDPQNPQPMGRQEEVDFLQAVKMLKDDRLRGFRLDIETDSTIEVDAQAEKADRLEFLKSAAMFISGILPAAQQIPSLTPLFGQMLLFGARAFKTSRDLESTLEQTVRKLDEMAGQKMGFQPQDQKAGTEQQKMQLQQQMHQDSMQLEQVKHHDETQLELLRLGMEHNSDNMDRTHEANMAQMNGGPPQGQPQQPQQMTGDPQKDMQIIAQAKAAHDAAGNDNLHQLMQAHMAAREQQSPDNIAAGARQDIQQMAKVQSQAFAMMAQSQNDALTKIAMAMQQSSENLVKVAQLLTAPKEVIRNDDGVAIGVRTVTN